MTLRRMLLAVITLAASATALAQSQDPAKSPADSSPPANASLLQSCADHKFETTVESEVDGKPRRSKVTLCGVAGQSDADWKRTLEDAVRKTQANDKMSAAVKEQIVTALNQEIAKLDTAIVRPAAEAPAAVAPQTSAGSALSIPPIAAPLTPARPAAKAPPRPLERDYGSLQPLPPPPPPAATSVIATSMMPTLASPKIRLFCSTSTDPHGAEECINLASNTIFTIRADESLSGDTSLRFLRKGDPRGDVNLAAMRKGQSVRVPLPRGVCAGVTRGTVDIEVMRRGSTGTRQIVDSLGPYDLRC